MNTPNIAAVGPSISAHQPASVVSVTITDMTGKVVYRNKSSENFPSGVYMNRISTDQMVSGTYLVTIETANYRETKKLIIQ
ncbi:MAG: T9SS type A sorting domain-containing protein [Chryseobacterium sp.]|nr:T9SS type A sorting domain-containing protein [Chryseobacterium sp.]